MKRWSIGLGLVALVGCATEAEPVSVASQALEAGDKLVIRSVYGGGGNGLAAIRSDYVELFNAGTTTLSLDGLSLQYAAATGNVEFGSQDNRLTVLPTGVSLLPGQSYLVRGDTGTNVSATVDLVAPHFLESGQALAMGGSAGRLALVNGTAPVTCKAKPATCNNVPNCITCDDDPSVIDMVGWGSGDGVTFGTAAAAPTNADAVIRKGNGCTDTRDNSADFELFATARPNDPTTAPPILVAQPRTTDSPLQPCTVAAEDAGAEEDAAVDAGPAPIDAGSESDAGIDAGPAPVDAGAEADAAVDAGPAPIDAGDDDAGVVLPELPEGLLIRQVYGGGGNGGSVLKTDFIELFNAGQAAVSTAGLSLQYAPASGGTLFGGAMRDRAFALPAATLAPGQSFLVAGASQGGGTEDLPTPDATGTVLALAGTAGRVALALGTTPLECSPKACTEANCVPCTEDPRVVDLVGYGPGDGLSLGAPTAPLTNTSAANRLQGGCQNTGNNSADFEVIDPPAPRNTSSPLAVCGTVVDPVDAGTDPVDAGSEPTPDAGSTPVDAGSEPDAAISADAGSEPADGSDQDGSDQDGSDQDGTPADGTSGGDGWFDDGSDDVLESKDSSCSVTSYGNAGSAAPLAFAGLALVLARRRRKRD